MTELEDDLFAEPAVVVWSDAEMLRAVALIVFETAQDERDECPPNYDW